MRETKKSTATMVALLWAGLSSPAKSTAPKQNRGAGKPRPQKNKKHRSIET